MKSDYALVQMNSSNMGKVSCAKRFAAIMRENPSYLERKMMDLLHSLDIKYDFQHIIFTLTEERQINKFYIADFFIRQKNIIIEVDGKFHEQQQEKDQARIEDIQKRRTQIFPWQPTQTRMTA